MHASRHSGQTPDETTLARADLEALRDLTFRRRPSLKIGDVRAVARFVDQVGFAFLYRSGGSELPSVWGAIAARRDPRLPRHIQRHAGVGLAWEAKDVLAARKRIYYGKLLRGAPTLVSLELFPAFYALSGNRGEDADYLRWARAGLLSRAALRIAEALVESPPLTTQDLKALTGHAGAGSRASFDRAMAELQGRMLLVKYAELYHPRFTFVWGPLHRWLPEAVARARTLDPAQARETILERYLEVRWAASVREMERLFGWPRPSLETALSALARRGNARPLRVEGLPGEHHALASIGAALRKLRRAALRKLRSAPRSGAPAPRARRGRSLEARRSTE